MELIFESVEERDEFFRNTEDCPGDHGLHETPDCLCRPGSDTCVECWEQSGVKYRIKGQPTPWNPVSIEDQEGSIIKIVIDEPLRPGDKIVKKDGKFYVEKRPEGWWKDNPYLKVDIPKPEMHIVYPRHCGRTADYSMIDEIHEYCKNDVEICMDAFRRSQEERRKLQIEKVIFNDPATIVFWKDGTKTVVKCQDGDKFDEEKGLAMAICKKVYGNDSGYFEEFKKWLPKESASKRLYTVGKLVSEAMNESMRRATESLKNLEKALDGIATVKRCGTCTYEVLWKEEEPCRSCVGRPEPSNWKPKSSEPLKPCEECKHADVHEFHEPCRSCSGNSGFEEKEAETDKRIRYVNNYQFCPICNLKIHEAIVCGRKEIYCYNCGTKLAR